MGGREGRAGQRGGRKFYLGTELIKCIDPNEGEALRRGSTFKPGMGGWGWRPSAPPPMGDGRAGGGRRAGGRI